MAISPFGLVLEQLHNVTSDQQMLRVGNELAVQAAGVVLPACLPTLPVGDQNHHPSTFFGENGVADDIRNGWDILLHASDDPWDLIICE
jgi:hypothetical protein